MLEKRKNPKGIGTAWKRKWAAADVLSGRLAPVQWFFRKGCPGAGGALFDSCPALSAIGGKENPQKMKRAKRITRFALWLV